MLAVFASVIMLACLCVHGSCWRFASFCSRAVTCYTVPLRKSSICSCIAAPGCSAVYDAENWQSADANSAALSTAKEVKLCAEVRGCPLRVCRGSSSAWGRCRAWACSTCMAWASSWPSWRRQTACRSSRGRATLRLSPPGLGWAQVSVLSPIQRRFSASAAGHFIPEAKGVFLEIHVCWCHSKMRCQSQWASGYSPCSTALCDLVAYLALSRACLARLTDTLLSSLAFRFSQLTK